MMTLHLFLTICCWECRAETFVSILVFRECMPFLSEICYFSLSLFSERLFLLLVECILLLKEINERTVQSIQTHSFFMVRASPHFFSLLFLHDDRHHSWRASLQMKGSRRLKARSLLVMLCEFKKTLNCSVRERKECKKPAFDHLIVVFAGCNRFLVARSLRLTLFLRDSFLSWLLSLRTPSKKRKTTDKRAFV